MDTHEDAIVRMLSLNVNDKKQLLNRARHYGEPMPLKMEIED